MTSILTAVLVFFLYWKIYQHVKKVLGGRSTDLAEVIKSYVAKKADTPKAPPTTHTIQHPAKPQPPRPTSNNGILKNKKETQFREM